MSVVFTVITEPYISYAKTLGDSVLKHNPGYKFVIGLIGNKGNLHPGINISKFEVIEITTLDNQPLVASMQAKYTPFELSCALKPYFASHILKDKSIRRLKYLDSDVMVFNGFDKGTEENAAPIFLTPHFFTPVNPAEKNTTNDLNLLVSGTYNAGYFELANTAEAHSFLNWWKERLADYCYIYKSPTRISADQTWLNLVPVFFPQMKAVEHPGYNAAFYNLHERKISKHGGNYLVNGQDLVFFHFTAYRYHRHEAVSPANAKYTYQNTPFLEELCNTYREALLQNLIAETLPPNKDKPQLSPKEKIIKAVNATLTKTLGLKLVRSE